MFKISIIVPIYNVEKYLARCIDSILIQTFEDFELILVNDGSTDNSGKICEEYKCRDKRIKVIHKENKGVSSARNTGIKNSLGEYIYFIDPDDWIEKNAIETLYKLAKKENYDLIQFKYIVNDKDKNRIYVNKNENVFTDENLLKMTLLGKNIFSVWSKFIKREFILNNNILFNEDISCGEDLLYTVKVAIHKPKYIFINEYLYNYYKHDKSLSHAGNDNSLDILKYLKDVKTNLLCNNLYDYYMNEYKFFTYMQCFFLQYRLYL